MLQFTHLPTKETLDHNLYYVPKAVRSFADSTTAKLFRIMYRSAKITSTPAELEKLRKGILHFTAKLEESIIGNSLELTEEESCFAIGLTITGAASFALAVASCAAGYILLPVISIAVCWMSIAPFLSDPNELAPKLRSDFDTPFQASFQNAITRGTGFFANSSNPFTTISNWFTTPRANRGPT